jgi:hypothetical protein
MNTKTLPPSPEVRLTIPVSADVHEAFKRISNAGNMPVGRAMGEWLADTLEAAQFMASKMEEARIAPRLVAQELHSYALGLQEMTSETLAAVRRDARAAQAVRASAETVKALTTPLSNTGGELPTKPLKTRKTTPKGKL